MGLSFQFSLIRVSQNQNSKKDYSFPKLTWPAPPEHYPSREIKVNAPYFTSLPPDKDPHIELKRESPPSTRIFYNEPLLRETTYMQQNFQVPQNPPMTMMMESSRYDLFNPKYLQNQPPPPQPLQSSVVVDMRNARMSDNNFQVKYNNQRMDPNLFDLNTTQDEIEIKDLMPSLNSKAYKNFNAIQHHQNPQHDYLNQIRQPNLIKEKEGVLGSFNFKQQTGGEYVITKFQRMNEPEMHEERIMKIPPMVVENNPRKATEINRIPQPPLITITPSDDAKQENIRINPAQKRDSLTKKRKREEFENFPFAASTQDMKSHKLVKTTPNDENVQPNIPKQGFQFKKQSQNPQPMSYLIPPKKNTLGRNIQINLKKPPSINTTAHVNNNKPVLHKNHLSPKSPRSPKSPQNMKKIVSNTKKSKDSNPIDTRFDRFVYSRKKVPRTREEGELKNLDAQKPVVVNTKKTLLTSQVIHPKKVTQIQKSRQDDSPKLFSESSTITGSFLTPKSAKLPSEDEHESLKAILENSKLSTIRPIKVQKIEVLKKEETPGHKFIQATVEVTHAEYKKINSEEEEEKGIFATTNLKTDVSFSELNQTGESDDEQLSEMIETLVNKKDSL